MQDLEQRQGKRARLLQTRESICVSTLSGRGLLRRDPQGLMQWLDIGASDSALGSAVLESLAKSRVLTPEESEAFFDRASGPDTWDAWVLSLMSRYHYPSREALLRHMESCLVRWVGDEIEYSPSRHKGFEAWRDLGPSEAVTIRATTTAEENGPAARIALE